jgi:chromosome segregation ATPase
MQLAQASIEGLMAIMRDKDAKLSECRADCQDLLRQFEVNYEMIQKRDENIEQLRLQIESYTAELEATQSRSRLTTQAITRASDRLTTLEKRAEDLKKKIHLIHGELLTVQFETEKLREVKPLIVSTVDPNEVQELRVSLADAERRRAMTLNLIADIKNESQVTIDSLSDEYEEERKVLQIKVNEYGNRRSELLAAIRGIEREMRDQIDRIEMARRELEDTFETKSGAETEISSLKNDIREIDVEIAGLDSQAEEARKAEEQRRSILQTIKQKMDERSKITDEDILRAQSVLENQKREISKLSQSLEAWNERLETASSQIDELESGMKRKPNIGEYLESEKAKLDRMFTKRARKELRTQQRISGEQSTIELQITQQRSVIDVLVNAINKCVQDARRRSEFAHQERKKGKLISVQIQGLEGELEGLRQKEDPVIPESIIPRPAPAALKRKAPPPLQISHFKSSPVSKRPQINLHEVENLSEQLERYHAEMEEGQKEMQRLKADADGIAKDIEKFTAEGLQLKRDLSSFEDVRQYLVSLKSQAVPKLAASPVGLKTKPQKRSKKT